MQPLSDLTHTALLPVVNADPWCTGASGRDRIRRAQRLRHWLGLAGAGSPLATYAEHCAGHRRLLLRRLLFYARRLKLLNAHPALPAAKGSRSC